MWLRMGVHARALFVLFCLKAHAHQCLENTHIGPCEENLRVAEPADAWPAVVEAIRPEVFHEKSARCCTRVGGSG